MVNRIRCWFNLHHWLIRNSMLTRTEYTAMLQCAHCNKRKARILKFKWNSNERT